MAAIKAEQQFQLSREKQDFTPFPNHTFTASLLKKILFVFQ